MKDNYIVYKYFGEDNVLLYVGITCDMRRRLLEHKLYDRWFKEVTNIEVSTYLSRNESHIYEIYYISNEKPKYNIDYTKGGLIKFKLPFLMFEKYPLFDTKTKKIKPKRKTIEEILINFFEKIIINKEYRKELINKNILFDQGLSKCRIKNLFNIKDDTFKKVMKKPIMIKYIKDRNIDIKSNNRYIKLKFDARENK